MRYKSMKDKVGKTCLCLGLLMLSACSISKSNIEETPSDTILEKTAGDSYNVIVPYELSNSREYHAKTSNSIYDFEEVGNRLTELSKKHFPVSTYYLGEGQVITRARLTKLLGSESETNEIGLNPNAEMKFPSGIEGVYVEDPLLVTDVIEQDFYLQDEETKDYVLSGLSIAIILDSRHSVTLSNGTQTVVTISDDTLFDYGTTIARKLNRYLTGLAEAKGLPMMIAIYVNGQSGSYLPGHMIGEIFFKTRSPVITRLDESWVLFASTQATNKDAENSSQYSIFKRAVTGFINSNIGVVGQGFYEGDALRELEITVTYTPKTYTEFISLVRFISQQLQNFSNDGFTIKVIVKNNSETEAIVLKYVGNGDIQIIYL